MNLNYIVVPMPWGDFVVVFSHGVIKQTSLIGEVPPHAKPGSWPALENKLQKYAQGVPVDYNERVDWGIYPPFTASVLQYIYHELPWGITLTYGEVAQALNNPQASRAVGQAMGRNKVPLIVPCHRVVASHGLGGFSAPGGNQLKKRMLLVESIKV